ncbi:acyl-CoA dehydrogenase family protein [Mucilaginibacter sp.]|uniref:acyl-CoA dehydrogenase family protein n=1 Tax=Mucilaginibacter sp. TaxID=1882438 RepID=UPI003B0018F9
MTDQLYQNIKENAAGIDTEGAFPEQEFKWMAAAGLLGNTIADTEKYPIKTASVLKLLKRVGNANLSVGRIYEGHINALKLIDLYGNESQKIHWFKEVKSEKKLFSVWNTQADNGIKIHDLGDGFYRLEGCKTFCSGAGWIDRPLITGELISADKKGWQMCIVPTEKVKPIAVDSSFWKPFGMRASASFKMDFTGVEIQEKDLLGQPDQYYQQPYFSGGAIRFAAVQLGGAEAVLSETQGFLRMLGRTDDPFQQARIAEMTYLVESGNSWLNQAGNNTDNWIKESNSAEKIMVYTGMARTAIAEICTRVMHLSEQCVGARGLMRPNPLERIHRDLTFYLRQPAPDATLTGIGAYVLNQEKTDDLWN